MNFDKSVSQSKKPAYSYWQKLKPEVKEKLLASRPKTIGDASRIEGVTPAAISLITVAIAKKLK